jgi:uncharacterized protein (DUF58 family)
MGRLVGRSPRRPSLLSRWQQTWETHGVSPDYKGWVLLGLSLFFFIAGTNTLAGWLYVMSGTGFALMALAAYLTRQSLRGLTVSRSALPLQQAGKPVALAMALTNPTRRSVSLLQVLDTPPESFGADPVQSIGLIPPGGTHHWTYRYDGLARGLYRWNQVILRSAAPLGLFWHRRSLLAPAKLAIHPDIFPLHRCPLLDRLGQDQNPNLDSRAHAQSATEGLTRALRPYRWGDPTRLIHWRTSARYGELRVRELEIVQGGQSVVLALDGAAAWDAEAFEAALVAIASLYSYGDRIGLSMGFWSPSTGLLHQRQPILEALAAAQPSQLGDASRPRQPLIWVTQKVVAAGELPQGSGWLRWARKGGDAGGSDDENAGGSEAGGDRGVAPTVPISKGNFGLEMRVDEPLQAQLER